MVLIQVKDDIATYLVKRLHPDISDMDLRGLRTYIRKRIRINSHYIKGWAMIAYAYRKSHYVLEQ